MIRRHARITTLLLAIAFAAVSSGCVYRLTVQQGNLVDEENVEQVEIGMTRNQVRFLLGSPMIDDPFHEERWDYLYYVQQGRKKPYERHWITVFFEGNEVVRVVRGEPPFDQSEPENIAGRQESALR